jgi:hypothetical protein
VEAETKEMGMDGRRLAFLSGLGWGEQFGQPAKCGGELQRGSLKRDSGAEWMMMTSLISMTLWHSFIP